MQHTNNEFVSTYINFFNFSISFFFSITSHAYIIYLPFQNVPYNLIHG